MNNCPSPRVSPMYMCDWINVTLTQDGPVICGEFQAQERGAMVRGTVAGFVVGQTGVVAITGGDESIVIGRLERKAARLAWEKVRDVKGPDPLADGPSGVPAADYLKRDPREPIPAGRKCGP